MSQFFVQLGYNGWTILIDEGELMGRLSKKGRLNDYRNMAYFLFPQSDFESVFTLLQIALHFQADEYGEYQELSERMKRMLWSVLETERFLF